MSGGVRVRHATERNCMLTLVDGKQVLGLPHDCPVCGRRHIHKTFHILLGSDGSAIVSGEIWARLSSIPGSGFTFANDVATPPDQTTAIDRSVSFFGSEMTETPRGVVVHHPTFRNQRFVVLDEAHPYPVPYACPACATVHRFKAYHLTLDADGAVTVSQEVAEAVERLGMRRKQQPQPVRLVHAKE